MQFQFSFSLVEGFLLGGSLIIAIGAQNALILRQGLLKQHVFVLCIIASLADAALIVLGVVGMGALVQANEQLLTIVTVGGAIFLAIYAVLAARRALSSEALIVSENHIQPLAPILSALLAFTFLNPHVYLDTVVLLGGISGQYQGAERTSFAIGAIVASFVWFFVLGYGARWLAPLFAKPMAWRIFESLIAIVMLGLSMSLISRVM